MITKIDVPQVIRMSRAFGETRKETHLVLTSTHPIRILPTGVKVISRSFTSFREPLSSKISQESKKIVKEYSSNFGFLRIQIPKFSNSEKAPIKIFRSKGGGGDRLSPSLRSCRPSLYSHLSNYHNRLPCITFSQSIFR